jgi:hypothetical protein
VINWQNVSHFSSPAQLLHLMPDEKKRQKVEKNEDWKLTLKAAKKWLKGRPPTEKEEPTATLRAGDRILYLAPGTGPSQGHYREATICEVKSPKYMQQFGVALRLDSGDMLSSTSLITSRIYRILSVVCFVAAFIHLLLRSGR